MFTLLRWLFRRRQPRVTHMQWIVAKNVKATTDLRPNRFSRVGMRLTQLWWSIAAGTLLWVGAPVYAVVGIVLAIQYAQKLGKGMTKLLLSVVI